MHRIYGRTPTKSWTRFWWKLELNSHRMRRHNSTRISNRNHKLSLSRQIQFSFFRTTELEKLSLPINERYISLYSIFSHFVENNAFPIVLNQQLPQRVFRNFLERRLQQWIWIVIADSWFNFFTSNDEKWEISTRLILSWILALFYASVDVRYVDLISRKKNRLERDESSSN